MDSEGTIQRHFDTSIAAKHAARDALCGPIAEAARSMAGTVERGGKILACGNGGSAGDAMHLASELINRFERERAALPAVALTADTPTLTSIANDASYERIFARQVEGLGRAGDVLVAISTSGHSPNVTAGVATAHALGLSVIALTGKDGGPLADALAPGDAEIRAPSDRTARVQEIHLVAIHAICDLLDQHLFGTEQARRAT